MGIKKKKSRGGNPPIKNITQERNELCERIKELDFPKAPKYKC